MIIDVHVHSYGKENPRKVVAAMDKAGIDRICLFAPCYLRRDGATDIERQRSSTDFIATFGAYAPERISSFAFIEPVLKGAADEVDRAVEKGIKGFKMMPNHWYPYDEKIFPVYRRIEATGLPVLFHSGILYSKLIGFAGSRFCRPVYYESLLYFPKLRFALAHVGWPWTDECIATCGTFRADAEREKKNDIQMRVDLTPGTPPIYRPDVLRKALSYLGEDLLIYGSDTFAPEDPEDFRGKKDADLKLFREELNLTKETIEKIMSKNALKWLEGK